MRKALKDMTHEEKCEAFGPPVGPCRWCGVDYGYGGGRHPSQCSAQFPSPLPTFEEFEAGGPEVVARVQAHYDHPSYGDRTWGYYPMVKALLREIKRLQA